ncbi:MAG: galactose oxidase-like domain-containing protein [Solirubrobacteraceae bacterium]
MLVPAAGSHGGGAQNVKLDAGETAALGEDHARAHARARALERIARKRWNRLTPAQRRHRLRVAELATRRFNRRLAARPRDDTGYWGPARFPLPDYAIHVSMMPTGDLLIFGRQPLQPNGTRSNLGSAAIFDPRTGRSRPVPPPPIPENAGRPAAIYCAGQALLSDGRVLVVGGNLADPATGRPHSAGLRHTFLFDPWTQTWEIGPRMSRGRWYPSAVKLSSGDILIMSGLDETGLAGATPLGRVNPQMDLFRPGIDDHATALTPFPGGLRDIGPDAPRGQSLYPRLFTLPDGNVALASPDTSDSAILNTRTAIDRTKPPGSAWTQLPTRGSGHYGAAAVLEPQMGVFGGSWDVLVSGGRRGLPGTQFGRTEVERLDAHPAGPPRWLVPDKQEDLKTGRYWLNNVLLPDGGMVVVGGGSGFRDDTRGEYYVRNEAPPQLRQVELRGPGEKSWRLGAAQQEWRTYHSTAALLPDARIFSGGDDFHEGPAPFAPLPDHVRRDSAEIYWPPYLFNGDSCAPRPAIRAVGAKAPPAAKDGAPWASVGYGETFGIVSEHARARMQATLVAPSAVTHSFDMNQRVVPLRIASRVSGGGLNARAPANGAIAPPGWYMLFVVDADGTPSIARWVRVLPVAQAKAARGGKALARVSGTRSDAKPRTCVNPDGTTVTERKLTAKLSVSRLTIRRSARRLDVRARITRRASGRVRIGLAAGGRRTSFQTKISRGRIRARRTISPSLAKLGTGIVTIRYAGDGDTRGQSVRLRAAPRAARLKAQRPTLSAAGRLRASGTISRRARGVVRVELQFELAGRTRTVQLKARIRRGRWTLSQKLSAAVLARIVQRTGTLHAYTLFTGDKRAAIRGEMRSHQVLGDN